MKQRTRPTPYSGPILLKSDRTSRSKKKSISWPSEETLRKIHYFELIPDERENVSRPKEALNNEAANACPQSIASSSQNAHANRTNPLSRGVAQANIDGAPRRPIVPGSNRVESNEVNYSPWRLILIDFTPELPSPGWNSIERSAQAERETYVLGAIDLPGQPSTLDEPDNKEGGETAPKDEAKIIPLDNPEGMYTEYPDIYNSEIVNGVRVPTGGSSQTVVQSLPTFVGQSSQLIPEQFQQQLVNVAPNQFAFQEMSAQFQQQQQPQQYPFVASQQQPQQFQTPFVSQPLMMQPQQPNVFMSQQPQPHQQVQPAQQQSGVPGPIMPWLNYPFNHVNENSHAHLFRRPAT